MSMRTFPDCYASNVTSDSVSTARNFSKFSPDLLLTKRKNEINKKLTSSINQSVTKSTSKDCVEVNVVKRKTNRRFSDTNRLGNFFELRPINNWYLYLENEKIEFYYRYRVNYEKTAKRKDFKFIKTIGTGVFAKVMIAMEKGTRLYYAVKIYDKQRLVYCDMVKLVENERKALKGIRFPFIINSEYFFQDYAYLFFVLPLCLGGELHYHLKYFRTFSEYYTKFITAQVILALEYLHFMDIIYRDLKPENIVLDHNGFIKITDLTACKFLYGAPRTYTMCGTPEYIAPEMLTKSGYNKTVDFWQLGILIYNLVFGVTPFYHRKVIIIYRNILDCQFKYPSNITDILKDLISKFLRLIPETRLGANGFEEIKEHPWFDNINWSSILNKTVRPPFVPDVKDVHDTSYFSKYKEIPLRIEKRPRYCREFANF